MRRLKLILLVLLIFAVKANAQFLIGYTGGHTGLHELNREIYIYNEINGSNLKERMHPIHWFQGPTIGVKMGDEVYFEFLYTRKKARTESSFDDTLGVPYHRQIKVYCNTFNFGIGKKVGDWSFGGSLDFGRFKAFGRRGPEASLKDSTWTRLFIVDNSRIIGISVRLYFATTIWVERTFGIATIRLYTQPFAFRQEMDGLDNWFFPNRYASDPGGGAHMNFAKPNEEHFLNTGISIFLNIGGK
ncbi:MAG: hypothetical protein ABIS12_02345 [Bacteroidia bacterium]